MCEPVTLSAIGLGAMAIGGIVEGVGRYQEGQEDARNAEQNRQIANLASGDALQRGESDAGRIRMGATGMIGEQRVAIASSGVDSSSGSAVDLMSDTRLISEFDAQTVRNNAAREAWGYQVQGYGLGQQADRARQRATTGAAASFLGTFARSLNAFGGR